jgi:hypothetical protein
MAGFAVGQVISGQETFVSPAPYPVPAVPQPLASVPLELIFVGLLFQPVPLPPLPPFDTRHYPFPSVEFAARWHDRIIGTIPAYPVLGRRVARGNLTAGPPGGSSPGMRAWGCRAVC